jgi:hypothetical protein
MLGHGALGVWALGQLPGVQSGAAAVPGAVLPLHLALFAGAASGEGVLPPLVIGGRPSYPAWAPGAEFDLWVSLTPGRAMGVAGRRVNAAAPGAVLAFTAGVAAGAANGEGQTEYDNAVVLLLAA